VLVKRKYSLFSNLTTTDIPRAQLEEKDKSEKGFKMFMAAHHFPGLSRKMKICWLLDLVFARGTHEETLCGSG
jgi:hypothetical protein